MGAMYQLQKLAKRCLPGGLSRKLRVWMMGTAFGDKMLREAYEQSIDVYLISFPKCGRTWLRLMIGKVLALEHGIEDPDKLLGLEPLCRQLKASVPLIRVTHDDNPHHKSADELSPDKSLYAGRKVILLVRDPRDVLVSLFFQNKYREQANDKPMAQGEDLDQFIRSDVGGIESMIRFYNIWAEAKDVPSDLLLLKYEDMRADPFTHLRRVIDFLGLQSIPDQRLRDAVAFTDFDNMRKMEKDNTFSGPRMTTNQTDNPEAFKTRRGKVGGYVDYMNPGTIAFVTEYVDQHLSPMYGYAGLKPGEPANQCVTQPDPATTTSKP